MDLKDDLSWMHSWRVMYLTYCLGCSANPEERKELEERNAWIQARLAKDPRFETTKLEWARKLGDAEVSVLEDPLKNYAQMGSKLPPGTKEITHAELIAAAKERLFLAEYMWLPNREAPDEDVKGLARLKGHLQKGKWLTKFRKVLRKDEM